MTINSISNKGPAFGALMLERKRVSSNQQKIINNICDAVLDKKYYLTLLENNYSDVYISPNDDNKSVDLKIITAAGRTDSFIPEDEDGKIVTNIHVPDCSFAPENKYRLANNIKLRTLLFLERAATKLYKFYDFSHISKLKNMQSRSCSDSQSDNDSTPRIVQDATCLISNENFKTKKR